MTKDEFIIAIKLKFGKDVLRIDRFQIINGATIYLEDFREIHLVATYRGVYNKPTQKGTFPYEWLLEKIIFDDSARDCR